MTTALGARNLTLTILVLDETGTQVDSADVSDQVINWSLATNQLNTSQPNGRISWRGSFTLANNHPTLSLDPRNLTGTPSGAEILARGNRLAFQLADSTDTLRNFPSTLWINAVPQPPNLPQNIITLEVADTLQVENFPKPEGLAATFAEGTSTDRKAIIDAIATSEGLPGVDTGDTLPEYPLTRPPQKTDVGSWANYIGQLAGSAGYMAWINAGNQIKLTRIDLNQSSPAVSFTIGPGGDEETFDYVTQSERPPETLEVRGTGYDSSESVFPRVTERTTYTTRGALLGTSDTGQIIASYERVTENLTVNGVLLRDTVLQVPKIIIDPTTTSFRTSLRVALRADERQTYRADNQAWVKTTVDESWARGYINKTVGSQEFTTQLTDEIPYRNTLARPFYDSTTGQQNRELIEVDSIRASLGAGLTPADTFERTQEVDSEWREKGGEQWAFERLDRRTAQEVYSGDVGDMSPFALVPDPANSESIQTNTGEANPPQTKRLSQAFNSKLKQFSGQVSFKPIAGRAPRQAKLDTIEVQGPFCVSDAQCVFLAGLEGQIRQGRALAAQYTGLLPDWFLTGWFPLPRFDFTVGGTITAYYADQVSVAGDQTETVMTCYLLERGIVGASPTEISPRYTAIGETNIQTGSIITSTEKIELTGDDYEIQTGSIITSQASLEITANITLPALTHNAAIENTDKRVFADITLPALTHSAVVLGPDPNFSSVSLLLHCDGTNGSTSFPDSSSNMLTVTANGDAQVTTTNPKFGTGAALFDGNDTLTVADTAVLDFGTGDFTIEMFARQTSATGFQTVYDKGYTETTGLLMQTGNGDGRIIVYVNGTPLITASTAISTSDYTYVALKRDGTTLSLWIDGTQEGSVTSSQDLDNAFTLGLGAAAGGATGGVNLGDAGFNGRLDEIRITKGVARDVSSIPEYPFPDS